MSKTKEFLDAVRGIPGNHVAQAMNITTSGIVWTGCSKAAMASSYEKAHEPSKWNCTRAEMLQKINLSRLASRARARMNGIDRWQEVNQ